MVEDRREGAGLASLLGVDLAALAPTFVLSHSHLVSSTPTKMDWLKSEIDSKKRALTTEDGQPAPKYIKRADLERQRQKERDDQAAREVAERQERLLAAAKKVARKEDETANTLRPPTTTGSNGTSKEGTPASGAEDDGAGGAGGAKIDHLKPEAFNLSNEEAIARLRRKGQPIRLFGESDKERRLRLRALELIEERSEGQRNDFMRAMDGVEVGFNLEEVAKKSSKDATERSKGKEVAVVESKEGTPAQSGGEESDREPNPKDEEVIVDVSLAKSNPHKIYPQIYHALKVRASISSCCLHTPADLAPRPTARPQRMGAIPPRPTRFGFLASPQSSTSTPC